jgi:accessory gene regulator protein AgrB
MFLYRLREIDEFGVFVTPAAPLLLVSLILFFLARWLAGWIDLNRYVWNLPLFEIAIFVAFYALAVLTLRPG